MKNLFTIFSMTLSLFSSVSYAAGVGDMPLGTVITLNKQYYVTAANNDVLIATGSIGGCSLMIKGTGPLIINPPIIISVEKVKRSSPLGTSLVSYQYKGSSNKASVMGISCNQELGSLEDAKNVLENGGGTVEYQNVRVE